MAFCSLLLFLWVHWGGGQRQRARPLPPAPSPQPHLLGHSPRQPPGTLGICVLPQQLSTDRLHQWVGSDPPSPLEASLPIPVLSHNTSLGRRPKATSHVCTWPGLVGCAPPRDRPVSVTYMRGPRARPQAAVGKGGQGSGRKGGLGTSACLERRESGSGERTGPAKYVQMGLEHSGPGLEPQRLPARPPCSPTSSPTSQPAGLGWGLGLSCTPHGAPGHVPRGLGTWARGGQRLRSAPPQDTEHLPGAPVTA